MKAARKCVNALSILCALVHILMIGLHTKDVVEKDGIVHLPIYMAMFP